MFGPNFRPGQGLLLPAQTVPRTQGVTGVIPLTKNPFVHEDEGTNLRGTTPFRQPFPDRRTPRPNHHQGLAVTGLPAPFYSPQGDFFGDPAGRPSVGLC